MRSQLSLAYGRVTEQNGRLRALFRRAPDPLRDSGASYVPLAGPPRVSPSAALATCVADVSSQNGTPAGVPTFAEPGISPDHSEIAFVSGGDIWTVPSTGGVARLLVSHPANESRPLYSPDGKRLAFISTRTGGGDVYVLTFATGDARPPHVRRRARPARLVVARRQVALLLVHEPRDRRHERRVPRERRGRHAHARERRPLHERVLGGAGA